MAYESDMTNVAGWDAALRAVVAVLLVAGSFYLMGAFPHWWSVGVGGLVLVAYLVLTALIRVDPGYIMLDYNTSRTPRRISRTMASRRGRTIRP